MLPRIAKAKGHLLSRVGVASDHLHITLGDITESPSEIALAYMNNLAHAHGSKPVFQEGFYVGRLGGTTCKRCGGGWRPSWPVVAPPGQARRRRYTQDRCGPNARLAGQSLLRRDRPDGGGIRWTAAGRNARLAGQSLLRRDRPDGGGIGRTAAGRMHSLAGQSLLRRDKPDGGGIRWTAAGRMRGLSWPVVAPPGQARRRRYTQDRCGPNARLAGQSSLRRDRPDEERLLVPSDSVITGRIRMDVEVSVAFRITNGDRRVATWCRSEGG